MTLLFSLFVASAHPYTIQDQVLLRRISNLAVAPDGMSLAYALRSVTPGENRARSDLWLASTRATEPRRLTSHPENDSDPQWAHTTRTIYFLSTRSGTSQIWRLDPDGGEAEQQTDFPVDVDTFRLGPDDRTIIFSAETFSDCATLQCSASRVAERKKKKGSGQIFDRLFMRHWDTWKDGRRSHLFVWRPGAAPKDLMAGVDMDAPSKPWGDAGEYSFTPDGKGVVYTARDPGKLEALSTDLDLWFVPLDGKAAPKKLTTANRATDRDPRFSPDGKRIAYLAMSRPMYESDKLDVIVRDWSQNGFSGKELRVTASWDRSVDALRWSADSKQLFVSADHVGAHALFSLDPASGEARELWKDGNAGELQVAKDGLVFARDTLKEPADLWLRKPDGALTRLTSVNAAALSELGFGDFEQWSFQGAGGDKVHAYLVKPVGFDPKKKYPLAYLIHGGPQGSFGNHFHYRWNPQVYAARGFAVIMVDFHGSTGYGQAFTDAIRGDWGGKPFEDLQKGIDAALARYAFIDGKRMCALGASYGGYMINWIAGNWPDRFRCLVSHDGNLDERFAYFDTEELWFPEWEHGGTPWEQAKGYEKHNPIDHVSKWKTPMLVIHGGRDYRVVETQGFAAFTALQRKGIPSRFLYFPDENHWVLKPDNSIEWHETVLAWLKQWTVP